MQLIAVEALLVVEAQVGVLSGARAVPRAPDLVRALSRLLLAARAAGVLVVHLQNHGAAGAIDEPGTPGWPIHPLLAPVEGEALIGKDHDDGFEGTELEAKLASAGVRCVAIAGVLSEMGVSATARTALSRGFQVVLVSDAHGTYDLDEIPHREVSRIAEQMLGIDVHVTTTSEIYFAR